MDIIPYFTHLTGLTPTKDQEDFLKDLVNPSIHNLAACAGRRTGKSLCTAVAVLWWIFEYPDIVNVLLMSSQDSYVYDHIETIFKNNQDLAKEVVVEGISGLVPLRGFQVRKGSRVHVRRGTEGQIRGLGCDICIIDEAASLPDKLLTTAMGNISGPVSKIVMLSTPHKAGMFTTIVSDPKGYKFTVLNWSEIGCNWIGDSILTLKRKTMSSQEWKMEVLGQVLSTSERAFFPHKDIDLCIKEHVDREKLPHSLIEMGLDWGESIGETVIVINERIHGRRKILHIKRYRKQMLEIILPEIVDAVTKFQPDVIRCDSRPSFAVDMARKVIPNIRPVDAVYNKRAMLAQLLRKIKSHQLEIPESDIDLIKQLKAYRIGKRAGDDIVDALALSIFETDDVIPGIVIVHTRKKF